VNELRAHYQDDSSLESLFLRLVSDTENAAHGASFIEQHVIGSVKP